MKIKKQLTALCMAVMLIIGLMSFELVVQAKVKLNKKSVTLTVGKTVTLKVTGTKKKVKWSSDKKRVATVSSKGKLKAHNPGKATVTAKVDKKKYKCKLTVVKNQTSTTTENGNEQQTTQEKSNETKTPGDETAKVNAGEYSINNIHSGDATFYTPTAGGAANLDDYATNYYTAAMNNYDYMNGLAGAYIEITDKDGDKINVLITDRLPEGAKGDIDLKPDAFAAIEPQVTGRMKITWRIIPLPTNDPIQYVFKPTSTQYWAEVQVRNHRYPIAKLEYLNASGQYVELPRQEYNYFTAASGLGSTGPYTFRVTDIYGHQLVDSGISINTTSTPINGAANFPY